MAKRQCDSRAALSQGGQNGQLIMGVPAKPAEHTQHHTLQPHTLRDAQATPYGSELGLS